MGEVSFTTNSVTCDCSSSKLNDKDHNHTVTGDLTIIRNSKLRKLLTKEPTTEKIEVLILKLAGMHNFRFIWIH